MKTKIIFPKETDTFLSTLNKRIDAYFLEKGKDRYGNKRIIQRYLIIKTLIIINYVLMITSANTTFAICCFALLGPLFITLALNVSHDAVHGVAHSNKKTNAYFAFQMDLFGANSFAWKKRHKIGHHAFPNIINKDPDLKQSIAVKIFPESKQLFFHKYQHIYVPILYSFYTINWIYIRDVKDFFTTSIIGKISKKEYMKFFIFKFGYLLIFYGIPIGISTLSLSQVLIANVAMNVCASYFLTIALIPSHVSEKSIFPLPNKEGMMPYPWSHHQVITTSDFATKSKTTTWLLGGFNHHITHHLFPSIAHVYYPEITPIIKRTILEFGLPYTYQNSLFKAYKSHYNLLKKNGNT